MTAGALLGPSSGPLGGLLPVLVGLAVLLGLAVGSFLNVVVWRLPRGESLSSPPSACPRCGHRIRARDNVPVLSWLVLRRRCRDCRAPISARYPAVEAATAVLFAAVVWRFGGGAGGARSGTDPASDPAATGLAPELWAAPAFLYLAAVAVALTLIDLDHHRLPDRIVLPSYVVGLVLLAVASAGTGDGGALVRAAAGCAILWTAYLLMALAYPSGMGFGDVKLAGVLGLYLGWVGWGALAVGAFAAFVLGGIFSVVLVASGRAGRKSGIPFGPWMLAGAAVGVAAGEDLWAGYLGLVL